MTLPLWILIVLGIGSLSACSKPDVVLYCSLDKTFAETFVESFEKESGLKVKAVYDIEANKTVGLVRTLLEEKDHPRCDVFWNNELAHTIKLENAGVLAPYSSPHAASIPARFRDPEGMWTAFAARARILIVNNELVPPGKTPSTYEDLVDPKWTRVCALARPTAGTTLTHMATLRVLLGDDAFDAFVREILDNDVQVPTGNAHVMKLVSAGEISWGFTDTDDFNVAREVGSPVRAVYPDQEQGEMGTLLIPNSVALIRGSPNPQNARKLIDYILRPETERILAWGESAQIPLRPGVEVPEYVRQINEFRVTEVDFDTVARSMDETLEILKKSFVK